MQNPAEVHSGLAEATCATWNPSSHWASMAEVRGPLQLKFA